MVQSLNFKLIVAAQLMRFARAYPRMSKDVLVKIVIKISKNIFQVSRGVPRESDPTSPHVVKLKSYPMSPRIQLLEVIHMRMTL